MTAQNVQTTQPARSTQYTSMGATEQAGLTDQFGRSLRDLRISIIDRCNFRCDYCMPMETYRESYSSLSPNEYLSFEEILRIVRLFSRQGVRKIRITGGEPLPRPNLEDLISGISRVEGIDDIALTTNGDLLTDQAEAGLRRVTVSLPKRELPELTRRHRPVSVGTGPLLAPPTSVQRPGQLHQLPRSGSPVAP